MHRRSFMQAALAGALASGVPGWLRAQTSASAFDERAAAEPWLQGWQTFGRESAGPTVATLEGRWPGSLRGTLYRNGPGWFDRGKVRYEHWFDGDGLMRAWRIGGGKVTHTARMVATPKFTQEQRAGKFLVGAAGTYIPNAIPARNNDDFNTANTAVVKLGGKVFALWEGGSAFEVDPDTLATRGAATWRDDLVAVPFSAHPLLERDGSAWNFGSLAFFGGSGLVIWNIGADGTLRHFQMLESPEPGYLHAFAMTPKYLVFMLVPFTRRAADGAFFANLAFSTDKPCRIALVPKDALDSPRWFETDFTMAYHFGDAFERGNEVVMRTVRHLDAAEARSPMFAAMRGERPAAGLGTDLASLRLNLETGTARWEQHGVAGIEFPTWDERTPGSQPARLFAPCAAGRADAPYFNGVASIDAESGRVRTWSYGARVYSEEHRFVPRPGSRRPGEGWLLGTLLDYEHGRSGLAVLDAERVEDGPVATAWVPYTTPLGFHGWFA
ncbi:MAG TPA: carotenoid oxygenase family protein [Steroidobacteraceae bacterium]|nr:carotenoid oxygenase family protein [Steroidobacteraceae bacterium]